MCVEIKHKWIQVSFLFSLWSVFSRNDTTLPQQGTTEKIVSKGSALYSWEDAKCRPMFILKKWVRTGQATNLHGCHFTVWFFSSGKELSNYIGIIAAGPLLRLPVFRQRISYEIGIFRVLLCCLAHMRPREALRLHGSGLGRVEYRIGAFTTGALKATAL